MEGRAASLTTASLGDDWTEILDVSRWTPSPHNIQAWRFRRVDDHNLDILYDPKRLLPDTDPSGFFTLVGFGTLFEHMRIVAASRALRLAITYDGRSLDPNATGPRFLARAELSKGAKAPAFAPSLIKERRTSRLPYDATPLDPLLLSDVAKTARRFDHSFAFTSDPEMVQWLLELNRDTLFDDMADPVARKEVGGWMRYGRRQGLRRRDGLWSVCLGFPGWLIWSFVHMRWLFDVPGLRGAVRRQYERTTRGSTTIGWLAGPCSDNHDAVRAGQMLAEVWLALTAAGVYLHPFGSIITNKKAHARLAERIRVDEKNGRLWLVMRLGQSDVPPRSLRLGLDELLEP